MPNWCYNNLTVDGTREDVNNFLTAITNEDDAYDLTIPFPCPEELQITARFLSADDGTDDEETATLRKQYADNTAKYGATNWYDWQIQNWGTKWAPSVEDYFVQNDGKSVQFMMESAWSPPTQLIEKLSGVFPTLQFVLSYEEGGMCFAGAEGFYAGEMIYNGYFEYDHIPELVKAQEKLDNLDDSQDDDEVWNEYNVILRETIDQRWDDASCAVAEKASA